MSSILKILYFIYKNNKYYYIPYFCFKALVYQCFKRIHNGIISYSIFNGKKIFLFPNCHVSTMFIYTHLPDKEEILYLREQIKKNDNVIFLDIGSNVATYCICLSDILSKDKIIAFEPHPTSQRRAKMNFLLNDLDESCVKQIALSDKTGQIHFSNDLNSLTTNKITQSHNNSILVKTDTLDNFAKNNLNKDSKYIIKIDVEGYEKNVFLGGELFFKNYPIKAVCFECFNLDDKFKELLFSYGFKNIKQVSVNNYVMEK